MDNNRIRQLLNELHADKISLDEVASKFREYSWPHRSSQRPSSFVELAEAEQVDPDPYLPGSYDDVVAAYDRGHLTDEQYAVLVEAIADSEDHTT